MKTIGLFETKNRLSEVCAQVSKTREPVVVTRRGKALVKIVPIVEDDPTASVWGSVEESQARFGPLSDDLLGLLEALAERGLIAVIEPGLSGHADR